VWSALRSEISKLKKYEYGLNSIIQLPQGVESIHKQANWIYNIQRVDRAWLSGQVGTDVELGPTCKFRRQDVCFSFKLSSPIFVQIRRSCRVRIKDSEKRISLKTGQDIEVLVRYTAVLSSKVLTETISRVLISIAHGFVWMLQWLLERAS
jgi:hypothetical protein